MLLIEVARDLLAYFPSKALPAEAPPVFGRLSRTLNGPADDGTAEADTDELFDVVEDVVDATAALGVPVPVMCAEPLHQALDDLIAPAAAARPATCGTPPADQSRYRSAASTDPPTGHYRPARCPIRRTLR
ncbi:hypothetical protein [Actinomadura macrotermitis]|uniref:Uncharacterized protein n=1 Tax=Actinomadura macrotermitis TaxID=2585200 RepID=A0A7K0BUX8_9ACTN|nr:hypothetical protein [Actinomadura macrotermitis]MQY04998.1 hypothetical protein [Actinomadura macrotermitis]